MTETVISMPIIRYGDSYSSPGPPCHITPMLLNKNRVNCNHCSYEYNAGTAIINGLLEVFLLKQVYSCIFLSKAEMVLSSLFVFVM
jgi:hypothetical protein